MMVVVVASDRTSGCLGLGEQGSWGWGGGRLAKGPRCQVVPPAESNCDFNRAISANHGRLKQGGGSQETMGPPRDALCLDAS